VFLDEAFIKADARFAGRAVTAWQGLGFQLIIGAPLDKVSALEPHMSLLIQTVKNAEGHTHPQWLMPADSAVQSSFVTNTSDANTRTDGESVAAGGQE
jgi:uncharacterized protein YPO0396